ncbi:hypothetical protein BCY86_05730 [Pajaroellobacter abortibovis]|uniref:Uncharacterized protein n=1 Tax=Pajaroellobacter abortibovis TaxID=1882918 RepID=A0A1L6MXL5_9BACT|nr:hypothetical protein BCY86_05730 [Pajaroellobacter abortibovis]
MVLTNGKQLICSVPLVPSKDNRLIPLETDLIGADWFEARQSCVPSILQFFSHPGAIFPLKSIHTEITRSMPRWF